MSQSLRTFIEPTLTLPPADVQCRFIQICTRKTTIIHIRCTYACPPQRCRSSHRFTHLAINISNLIVQFCSVYPNQHIIFNFSGCFQALLIDKMITTPELKSPILAFQVEVDNAHSLLHSPFAHLP